MTGGPTGANEALETVNPGLETRHAMRVKQQCGTLALPLLLWAGGIHPLDVAAQPASPPPLAPGLLPYRADRILVQPKPRSSSVALASLHQAHRAATVRTLAQSGNLQVVWLAPGANVSDTVATYQRSGLVEYAEPDYWVQALARKSHTCARGKPTTRTREISGLQQNRAFVYGTSSVGSPGEPRWRNDRLLASSSVSWFGRGFASSPHRVANRLWRAIEDCHGQVLDTRKHEICGLGGPDDPEYINGTLWGFNNTGQNGGVADADIDAPEGWDILNSASDVIVAVIDSGIHYTHEDLAENMWVNPGEIPGNRQDDDGNGFIDDVHGINVLTGSGDPRDDYGHGTHIAGIIGAVGNNGKGVVGVAWRVRLMACKFLDQTGNGSVSDAVQCIDYARGKGARIINPEKCMNCDEIREFPRKTGCPVG